MDTEYEGESAPPYMQLMVAQLAAMFTIRNWIPYEFWEQLVRIMKCPSNQTEGFAFYRALIHIHNKVWLGFPKGVDTQIEDWLIKQAQELADELNLGKMD